MNHDYAICSYDPASVKSPLADLDAFSAKHGGWMDEAPKEDDIIYALAAAHIEGALELFRLPETAKVAERDFAALCDRHNAIGVAAGQFINYPWLRPPLKFPDADSQDLEGLGWSQAEIDSIQRAPGIVASVRERVRAAIGRLVSSPQFVAPVSELRSHWQMLAEDMRPTLPIRRSVPASAVPPELKLSSPPPDLKRFMASIDSLCDQWQIDGLVTWQLPIVRGPLLIPGFEREEIVRRGGLGIEVPRHFTLLAEDGVGPLLLDEHRRRAAELGIDDHRSWQTYAELLDINYWEHVFQNRYGLSRRPRAFVRTMENVLHLILDLSVNRVQRLRKTLRAFQSGRLTSLKGRR